MNRSIVERELKQVGVSLTGWMPVLQCDTCQRRWEPFQQAVGTESPTVSFSYWKCPSGCNKSMVATDTLRTAFPKYVEVKDNPGMIFGPDDLPEFERYVRSMDATEVVNRNV